MREIDTNRCVMFYLVSDDGIKVVDIHRLSAELTSCFQGR